MWKMTPVVFAVDREYQIMIPTECECVMKAEVGGKVYYDAANGIMRSKSLVHRVTVPMEELDRAKCYTVYLQKVPDRKEKFPETADWECREFAFKPVTGEKVRAFHIADSHGAIEKPASAAMAYGEIDFLILNGDFANNYEEEKAVWGVYELASRISKGNIPIVFSRGNHDMRGKYAEKFTENFPNRAGTTYYTFRLGNIWALVLDCGEDKNDEHPEYGGLVCCDDFREKETEYIKQVIQHAETEYDEPGVMHKMVISHFPFTTSWEGNSYMEKEYYTKWVALLRDYIKPEMILCGHVHAWEIYECGSEKDAFGQPCPVVIGAARAKTAEGLYFAGAGVEFSAEGIKTTPVEAKV